MLSPRATLAVGIASALVFLAFFALGRGTAGEATVSDRPLGPPPESLPLPAATLASLKSLTAIKLPALWQEREEDAGAGSGGTIAPPSAPTATAPVAPPSPPVTPVPTTAPEPARTPEPPPPEDPPPEPQ